MTYYVRNRLIIARKWGASTLGLTAGYLLKGQRNGCLAAAWAGIRAGFTAPLPSRRPMPPNLRAYLDANETRHRGSWSTRLRAELLRLLPG